MKTVKNTWGTEVVGVFGLTIFFLSVVAMLGSASLSAAFTFVRLIGIFVSGIGGLLIASMAAIAEEADSLSEIAEIQREAQEEAASVPPTEEL